MINLDGNLYSVFQTNYAHKETKLATTSRGVTGQVLRLESGMAQSEYDLTLLCSTNDIANLRTSFRKTVSNALLLVDEEGVTWSPSSGLQDATHYYLTGVYFDGFSAPKPLTPRGWNNNTFTVQIHLTTKTYNSSPRLTGYLITEASNYLNTESGNRLLWEK